jgi:hypothetical protein
MLNRLRFWWRAVSRGGTSLNTWAGWFGLFVLGLGVAAGITVPVVFHVSHWVTAVIIMGAVVLVVAEGSYLEWKDADELRRQAQGELENARRGAISASTTPEPPPFELRLYTRTPPEYRGYATSYYVGVKNPPDQPERRARVSVEGMDPYPRQNPPYPNVRPAIPHDVPPASGAAATAGLVVRPGQEQSWFLGRIGIGTDRKIIVFKFFSHLDAGWELGPDESWRLSYRIESDGVPDRKFSIVLAAEDGELAVRLED